MKNVKPKPVLKKCETCDGMGIPSERFCKACKKLVLDEAKRSGKILQIEPSAVHEQRGRKLGRSAQFWEGCADTNPNNRPEDHY